MLPLLIYVFVFFLGASIGSFINVVVHRIPMGLSLIHPHSHCPRCTTTFMKLPMEAPRKKTKT
ncbi:MAG: prepilin peptidase [Synechococcales cyanobacterium]